jgi:hypothetical protein
MHKIKRVDNRAKYREEARNFINTKRIFKERTIFAINPS